MENTIIRQIDELGRIVLPKSLRDALGLSAGDEVEITLGKDEIIIKRRYENDV